MCRFQTTVCILLFLGSHVTTFSGYTFIYHVGNKEIEKVISNICSFTMDDQKVVNIMKGAGKIGNMIIKLTEWERECKSYFNRYFKYVNVITGPSDVDMIMNTLTEACSEKNGRGFVFKNYNIAKHLEFLGYKKHLAKIGTTLNKSVISYLAYIQQKNLIFLCEKMMNGCDVTKCVKNITNYVEYFITLYNKKLQGTGVRVIGLLIRKGELVEKLVKCKFCYLFSPPCEVFESLTTFYYWLDVISTYGDWWDFADSKKESKLLLDIAAEIYCFMAMQENCLPSLTDNLSQQFKQTYLLYTPQQLELLFSKKRHVIIQGSYGSGKSIVGLRKLELILKCEKKEDRIIYMNFDSKSQLHFLMEKNVREYLKIMSRKIKLTNSIQEIENLPDALLYICHNKAGENLSIILHQIAELRKKKMEIAKTNFQIIVEEHDAETLTQNEAANLTEVIEVGDFEQSHIIILPQPLMKERSCNVGKKGYARKTCLFHKLQNTFKIVKLKQVFRSSNEIVKITESTQKFVENKESIFTTENENFKFKEEQKSSNSDSLKESERIGKNRKESDSLEWNTSAKLKESDSLEWKTSAKLKQKNVEFESAAKSKTLSDEINTTNSKSNIDLDQAFGKVAPHQNSSKEANIIVSRFNFTCDPKPGVDINGGRPKLVEFSDSIQSSNYMAVICLALVVKQFLSESKTTVLLHMTDEKPSILKRALHLLQIVLAKESILYTESIEEYLKKERHSKMVLTSNFRSVNGMEFDHVIVFPSYLEYYLKFYLPQVISRCTYNLKLVLLPNGKEANKHTNMVETKDTVTNVIQKFKQHCLMEQIDVVECKACDDL